LPGFFAVEKNDMRRKLVAGNWKMNGSLSSTRELLQGICDGAAEVAAVELAVFPPFVYLGVVEQQLSGSAVKWGAQNLCDKASGAYTGEIAGPMLNDFNCTYVIVGHSERRTLYGESDQVVANASLRLPANLVLSLFCASVKLSTSVSRVSRSLWSIGSLRRYSIWRELAVLLMQ
jgi:triosephosphate isomerase